MKILKAMQLVMENDAEVINVLFEIYKKNLEIQCFYITTVDLYRIITFIKSELQELID